MTAPQRWEPDWHMIDAVLSNPKSSKPITDMRPGDRAWIIAALELAGESGERSAERMSCSLRLIRSIRAEDATELARLLMRAVKDADDNLRAEQCEHAVTRRDLDESRAESARLRTQLDQVLDAHMVGQLKLFACGHPRVRYNVYTCRVRDRGYERMRDFCRECGREKSAGYRDRKRAKTSDQQNHSVGIESPHPHSVASAG